MTPAEQLAAPHTPDLWTYQRQRAWLGRITDADRRALQSAAAPSHTGLERLRELRNTHGFNIASRQAAGQSRVWEYRLAEDLPAAGGAA